MLQSDAPRFYLKPLTLRAEFITLSMLSKASKNAFKFPVSSDLPFSIFGIWPKLSRQLTANKPMNNFAGNYHFINFSGGACSTRNSSVVVLTKLYTPHIKPLGTVWNRLNYFVRFARAMLRPSHSTTDAPAESVLSDICIFLIFIRFLFRIANHILFILFIFFESFVVLIFQLDFRRLILDAPL